MEYPQPKSSLAVLIGAYRALIKPSFLLLKHACILTQKRKGCIPLSSYRRSKNNTLCYLTKIWPTVGLLLPFSSSNGPALYYSARQVERRCDNRPVSDCVSLLVTLTAMLVTRIRFINMQCNHGPATTSSVKFQLKSYVDSNNKSAVKRYEFVVLYIRWQEKTGYFFCLEDRALLCRPCDVAVHAAGAHVASHRRFLITGVRVGGGVVVSPATSSGNGSSSAPDSSGNPTTLPDKARPSSSVSAAAATEGLGGQQWPWSEFLADDVGVGMDHPDLCCPAEISEPGSSSLTG